MQNKRPNYGSIIADNRRRSDYLKIEFIKSKQKITFIFPFDNFDTFRKYFVRTKKVSELNAIASKTISIHCITWTAIAVFKYWAYVQRLEFITWPPTTTVFMFEKSEKLSVWREWMCGNLDRQNPFWVKPLLIKVQREKQKKYIFIGHVW